MMVGSTRKYGVKPLPTSRRSRRLRLFLLVATSTACVAICTYPFRSLSTSKVPYERICKVQLHARRPPDEFRYRHRRLLYKSYVIQWSIRTDTPPLLTLYTYYLFPLASKPHSSTL